ncbi:MAG: TIGR04255 family protein [Planctomycetes bacterium]|nr:TIGR04255 family protein [Planctomycetota bacterium]
MSEGRRYRKPPLVEALCEIFFDGTIWNDSSPDRFFERFKDRFPIRQTKEVREASIHIAPSGETASAIRDRAPIHQYLTEKRDCMIQVASGMLVVNKLRPYTHCEDWEPTIYSSIEVF